MTDDTAARMSTSRHDGLTEAEAAQQRKIKAIVIGLGILILLAFAGVIAGMVYRASLIGKGPDAAATKAGNSAAASANLSLPLQPDVKLSLPPGHSVKSATLSGTRLVVHHEGPAGGGLVILDVATGQIVSRITIETAPAR